MGSTNKLIEVQDPQEFYNKNYELLKYYETVRAYQCLNCSKIFTHVTRKLSSVESSCPECEGELDGYLLGVPIVMVENVTTVGQQIERNRKRLGRYGCEDKDKQVTDSFKADMDRQRRGAESIQEFE